MNVMSDRPGWAGQTFRPEVLPRIERVRSEVDRLGLSVGVEVDGGINVDTGRRSVDAGATVLAAASSIYRAADPVDAIRELAAVARGEGVV